MPDAATPRDARPPAAMPAAGPRRADARRNRDAVLDAAEALFDGDGPPVSVEAVARAAGVGKGTVFRAFGDRAGLLRALFDRRGQTLLDAVQHGPPPVGPGDDPRRRIRAVLCAVLDFKLANRSLSLALEHDSRGSPFVGPHYEPMHAVVAHELRRLDRPAPEYTAHVLLSAVRSDLVGHLLAGRRTTRRALRSDLDRLVHAVLAPTPPIQE